MTYIPSCYISVQQVLAGVGATTISAVNPLYTKLARQGHQSVDGTGFPAVNELRVTLASGTTISAAGQGVAYVTVEQFHPTFLRQPIQYGTITIANGNAAGSFAHGLTLGPKAYLSYLGMTSDMDILNTEDRWLRPTAWLNGAVVTASINTIGSKPRTILVNYCLVDPK